MGWFSDIVKKVHDVAEDIDPISTQLHDSLAKIPGSPQALEEGLYRGSIGQASWNPYDKKGVAVGDIWGGGTQESRDPQKRAIGRQIGTMIGSYFIPSFGTTGTKGTTASSGAGYTGTSAELAADGLGGVEQFGSTATAGETASAGSGFYDDWGASANLSTPEATQLADLNWGAPSTMTYNPNQATYQELGGAITDSADQAYKMTDASQMINEGGSQVFQDTGSQSFNPSGEGLTPEATSTPTLDVAPQDAGNQSLDLMDNPFNKSASESSLWSPPKTNYNLKTSFPVNEGASTMGTMKDYYKWGKLASDLYGGYDSYRSNKAAMEMMAPEAAAYKNTARELDSLYTDPNRGYDEFMMGQGRQFTTDARAQAARQGKIRSYMNSGKMNTDLMSLYMQNLDRRRESLSNTLERQRGAAQQYNQLRTNKNAALTSSGLSALGTLASMYK